MAGFWSWPWAPPAQIDMNLGGIQGIATLVDADSTLAVKVRRLRAAGADPESSEGIAVAELFTTNGRVIWQEEEQAKVNMPVNHVCVYEGANPPNPAPIQGAGLDRREERSAD